MPRDFLPSSVMCAMLVSVFGGKGYSFSMPASPAASITLNARYGLHAGSGARYSTRLDSSRPGLYAGTLTRSALLTVAQETYAGASNPRGWWFVLGASLLYELTHWFVTSVISLACRSSPAMKPLAMWDSLSSSSGSWKAFSSPWNNDSCVCIRSR